jgi:3-oxoacyl-(acyl-carrier-protein) synthase
MRRVAITGMGIVSSLGNSANEVANRIGRGQIGHFSDG